MFTGLALSVMGMRSGDAQAAKPLPFFDQLGKMTVDVDGAPNAYGPPESLRLILRKMRIPAGRCAGRLWVT